MNTRNVFAALMTLVAPVACHLGSVNNSNESDFSLQKERVYIAAKDGVFAALRIGAVQKDEVLKVADLVEAASNASSILGTNPAQENLIGDIQLAFDLLNAIVGRGPFKTDRERQIVLRFAEGLRDGVTMYENSVYSK